MNTVWPTHLSVANAAEIVELHPESRAAVKGSYTEVTQRELK